MDYLIFSRKKNTLNNPTNANLPQSIAGDFDVHDDMMVYTTSAFGTVFENAMKIFVLTIGSGGNSCSTSEGQDMIHVSILHSAKASGVGMFTALELKCSMADASIVGIFTIQADDRKLDVKSNTTVDEFADVLHEAYAGKISGLEYNVSSVNDRVCPYSVLFLTS